MGSNRRPVGTRRLCRVASARDVQWLTVCSRAASTVVRETDDEQRNGGHENDDREHDSDRVVNRPVEILRVT
jgi:hypothetical protein